MIKLAIEWIPRTTAIEPCLLFATQSIAEKLMRRIQKYKDSDISQLSALQVNSGVVLKAPTHLLPWIPGLVYFNCDESAPNVYLPCQIQPDVNINLFERACLNQFKDPPFVVLPEKKEIFSLKHLQKLNHSLVLQWLMDH